MPLRMKVGLGPGHIVLDRDPAPPTEGVQQPTPPRTFWPTLLWQSQPSQLLLSTCLKLLDRTETVQVTPLRRFLSSFP